MSPDLLTEIHAVCKVCAARRAALLLALQHLSALLQRAYDAAREDQWGDYEAAMDAMAPVRLQIIHSRSQLQQALDHEARLHRNAIDWAMVAAGEGES